MTEHHGESTTGLLVTTALTIDRTEIVPLNFKGLVSKVDYQALKERGTISVVRE